MAKNYTLREATEIILKGESTEEIIDITRRFPLLSLKLQALCVKVPNEFMELVEYFPEYLTATKVYKAMKNDEEKEEEPKTPQEVREEKAKVKEEKVVEDEVVEETKEETTKGATNEEINYDKLNRKQLYQLCIERGIKAEPKKIGKYYKQLLTEYDAKQNAKEEVVEETEDDDWDEEPTPVKEEPKKEVVKKEKKQPKKKEVVEEDEDDDWDI